MNGITDAHNFIWRAEPPPPPAPPHSYSVKRKQKSTKEKANCVRGCSYVKMPD